MIEIPNNTIILNKNENTKSNITFGEKSFVKKGNLNDTVSFSSNKEKEKVESSNTKGKIVAIFGGITLAAAAVIALVKHKKAPDDITKAAKNITDDIQKPQDTAETVQEAVNTVTNTVNDFVEKAPEQTPKISDIEPKKDFVIKEIREGDIIVSEMKDYVKTRLRQEGLDYSFVDKANLEELERLFLDLKHIEVSKG